MNKKLKLVAFILNISLLLTAYTYAESLGDLEVKWKVESDRIIHIEKDNDYYIFYNQYEILRLSKYNNENKKLKLDTFDYSMKKEGNNRILFLRRDNKKMLIKLINKNLDVLKEQEVPVNLTEYIYKQGDNIIIFGHQYNDFKTAVRLELDSEFKIKKEEKFTFNKSFYLMGKDSNNAYYFYTDGSSNNQYVRYTNKFEEISHDDFPANIVTLENEDDLKGIPQDDNAITSGNIYNQIKSKNPIQNDDWDPTTFVYKDNSNYIALFSQNYFKTERTGNVSTTSVPDAYLKYYNSNLNEKFSIKIPGESFSSSPCDVPGTVVSTQKYKDYIALAYNRTTIQSFKLYNTDGSEYKDLSSKMNESPELSPIYITQMGNGMLVVYNSERPQCALANKLNGNFYPTFLANTLPSPTYQSAVYYLDYQYNIETKINGKGSVTVQESANENDLVKFTITPEPGYVLSVVKVTDANGNVLTFTDYTFTMPSANVTIEATFIKEENASDEAAKPEDNPDTGAYIPYIIFSSAILIGIGIIVIDNRRNNKINKI